MQQNYDFCGWATRNDLKCSDGRIIRQNAFEQDDGAIVPLVWNHQHDNPFNVLGHAMLENRPEGVFTYGWFNDTEQAQNTKMALMHGDISALSIYANQLVQNGPEVKHGKIREVSLVLAGANPGASITKVIRHSDDGEAYAVEDEGIIYTGENIIVHADEPKPEEEPKEEEKMADAKEKTVQDVIDSMTDEQRNVMYALIGAALEDDGTEEVEVEEEEVVKHNIFDNDYANDDALMHSAMETIIADGKRYGSLKESYMAHAAEYGIDGIDVLFPEAKTIPGQPVTMNYDQEWVSEFMNSAHKTPFSKVKTMIIDITADSARALGYKKGDPKLDEVVSALKRVTPPTTIYKKQKLDRDDILDITDFDVVAYLKSEMRGKLNEEIARAALFSDGRSGSDDSKINEGNIRPIMKDTGDDGLYAYPVTTLKAIDDDGFYEEAIDKVVEGQDKYLGSGTIKLFVRKSVLTKMMLLKDYNRRRIYKDIRELETAMNVSKIVPVPDNIFPAIATSGEVQNVWAIAVDPKDYNFGANNGGSVGMFEDFDIDYNQQKYLMETRCSGALIKPHAAMIMEAPAESTNP